VAAAAVVYFYFNWVDPTATGYLRTPLRDLVVFVLVTGSLTGATMYIGWRLFGPVLDWLERLKEGADPAGVPPELRRRALNGAWFNATFSMAAWLLAGLFYFPYQMWGGFSPAQAWRVFAGIVFVGGPVAAALSFLVAADAFGESLATGGRLAMAGRFAASTDGTADAGSTPQRCDRGVVGVRPAQHVGDLVSA